jgi:hypothetical protein
VTRLQLIGIFVMVSTSVPALSQLPERHFPQLSSRNLALPSISGSDCHLPSAYDIRGECDLAR